MIVSYVLRFKKKAAYFLLLLYHKYEVIWGWRPYWLRACTALLEDLSSHPHIHMGQLTATCNPSSWRSGALFWPLRHLHSHGHAHTWTHVYIILNYKIKWSCPSWLYRNITAPRKQRKENNISCPRHDSVPNRHHSHIFLQPVPTSFLSPPARKALLSGAHQGINPWIRSKAQGQCLWQGC